jgi:hypothetical protein
MVIIVLLNVAFTWAVPDVMFLRSRLRKRVADPAVLAIYASAAELVAQRNLFLLSGDRSRWSLSGPGIGVCALPAYREALAVTQSTIATEIHQPFDARRDLSSQVALDGIVSVDHFAHTQNFVVGQLMHSPLRGDADSVAYLSSLSPTDAINVGESDRDPLLIGNVDASDARHLRFSSKRYQISVGSARRKGENYTEISLDVNVGARNIEGG